MSDPADPTDPRDQERNDLKGIIKPWRILESEMALDHPWYRVRRDTVELPDGKIIDDFYLSIRPEVVLIFPVTESGEVILVRQYKHGSQQILLEFPGGIFTDPNEDPLAAAARELAEETGYTSDRYRSLGQLWDDPAKQNNRLHLFLAEGARRTVETRFDETEFIELELVRLEDVPAMIADGRICTAGAVALAYRALQTLSN